MQTIAQTAARLAAGDITASELLESLFSRIDRLNPRLNALCHIDRDGAAKAAGESDSRRRAGTPIGPLDGIPLHIKDNLFVRGMPCTWGSKLYQSFFPDSDDWAVSVLRQQGAVLFAKTNTPEFALAGITTNDLFGTTFNPYNQHRMPGGSSGGAVAAAMAGLGFGGLATDAGGSIRRPAGYSGAVGLRTSPGAIRRKVGFPATVNDFQSIGPIAANLDDLETLFCATRSTVKSTSLPDKREIRIRLILEAGLSAIDPEVETATRDAAAALGKLGHEVTEINAPWVRQDVEYAFRIMSSSGAAHISTLHDAEIWQAQATGPIQAMAQAGHQSNAVDYVRALDIVAHLRSMAAEEFDGRTVWLMPTSPCTAWEVDAPYPAAIADKPAEPRDATIYAPVVNAMAATGLALPAGCDASGLPIGIQLVAGMGQEDLVLAVGRDLAAQLAPIPMPVFEV